MLNSPGKHSVYADIIHSYHARLIKIFANATLRVPLPLYSALRKSRYYLVTRDTKTGERRERVAETLYGMRKRERATVVYRDMLAHHEKPEVWDNARGRTYPVRALLSLARTVALCRMLNARDISMVWRAVVKDRLSLWSRNNKNHGASEHQSQLSNSFCIICLTLVINDLHGSPSTVAVRNSIFHIYSASMERIDSGMWFKWLQNRTKFHNIEFGPSVTVLHSHALNTSLTRIDMVIVNKKNEAVILFFVRKCFYNKKIYNQFVVYVP